VDVDTSPGSGSDAGTGEAAGTLAVGGDASVAVPAPASALTKTAVPSLCDIGPAAAFRKPQVLS
jgi:hypothetical protein